MFGTNDSAINEKDLQTSAYVPLEEYEKNMEMIITRAKKCSKNVIVLTPPAMDEPGRLQYQIDMYGDRAFARLDRSNEELQKYGMACKRACRKCVVPCEDMFVAFEHDTKGYFTDGIHFNAEGQQRVWERLKYRLIMEGVQPDKMQLDFPMGIDLREKGDDWEQLFEKFKIQNMKNRNGIASFDDSSYNLGKAEKVVNHWRNTVNGVPSSSTTTEAPLSSTAAAAIIMDSSTTANDPFANVLRKYGVPMNHINKVKIAIGFVAGAFIGRALSSGGGKKIVKVEVPGKEVIKIVKEKVRVEGPTRVITRYEKVPVVKEKIVEKIKEVKVPVLGPERIVFKDRVVDKEVPGPEKIVYKDRIVEKKIEVPAIIKEKIVEVKVPGPEKIVYKDRIVEKKVEVPGKERVVTKEIKVPGPEKIVYKDRIVEKKVEVPGKERVVTKEIKVPGPEKIVYKDKPVEKVVYKDKIVEKIVYKDKIVEKKVRTAAGGNNIKPDGAAKVVLKIGNTVGYFYEINKTA
jgi:hypothetical protein